MPESRQPNVLIFLPDAMQAQTLDAGHPCQTPHFDQLVQRGTRFGRATTVNPTCSPARASFMTGLLPHNHGVLEVEHGRDADQCVLRTDRSHFAQHLSAAGYRTGYFGKWHIERTNKVEDFGWQVNGVAGRSELGGVARGEDDPLRREPDPALSRYMDGPEGYRRVIQYGVVDLPPQQRPVGVTTNNAQQFLAEAVQHEQPWCCCVSFAEPNEALVVGREAFERYDVDALPLPATLHDEMIDRPALYRRVQQIFADMTDHEWRMLMACYYGRITELDEQFGRIMQQLEQADAMANTIVILVSDHGRYVGAHGMDHHNFGAFDEIYNVPLVVAGPGIAAGVDSAARVGLHDVGPTLLELCDAAPIAAADGRSFLPVLRDESAAAEITESYAEYHGTRFSLTQRVLWHEQWKLVFNGFDFDELYDLANDPLELQNLAADPTHEARYRDLMARMWEVMRRTGDRTLLESHYYPMRFGKVGPLAL